ncbi:MAG: peptidase [Thermoleophilia bacterium]|nr:peptidase [Thermoleophilia bacterium]
MCDTSPQRAGETLGSARIRASSQSLPSKVRSLLKLEQTRTDAGRNMHTPTRRAHPAVVFLLSCLGVLCMSSAAHAAAAPRLIVGFDSAATATSQDHVLRSAGVAPRTARAAVKGGIRSLDAVVVPAGAGGLAATQRRLLAQPGIDYVEIDHVARISGDVAATWTPNDTFFSQQWALATIGATQAWDVTRGAGIKIAIVDTGVDYVHPDLAGRVEQGYDFVDGDPDPMDVQGHGTHVAGIAAGNANDGSGIAGIAPEATILAVRVLDSDGAGNYSQVARGIVHASDKGAKVINLSLGGTEGSDLLESAVNYAASRGAIVVCASGNESAKQVGYPGRYDGCMSVGATDIADQRAGFSNFGPGLDITAPGAQILSSTMNGSHDSWDGTSMASPYVGGVAALLFAQGLGRRAVTDTIIGTARDLGDAGYDQAYGAGRLDAAAAVAAAARQPRSATGGGEAAPVVASLELKAPRKVVKATSKVVWKVLSRSAWTRVGTTAHSGTFTWSKTSTKGAVRTISSFRMRGGIVSRRITKQARSTSITKKSTSFLPIVANVSDDLGVDRVAFEVDGRLRAVDWNGADGWQAEVPCTSGARTIVVRAYDVSDRETAGRVQRTIRC